MCDFFQVVKLHKSKPLFETFCAASCKACNVSKLRARCKATILASRRLAKVPYLLASCKATILASRGLARVPWLQLRLQGYKACKPYAYRVPLLKSYETCKAHSFCQVSTYKSVLQDPWTLYTSILQVWEPCKFFNQLYKLCRETKHTNYLCDLTHSLQAQTLQGLHIFNFCGMVGWGY